MKVRFEEYGILVDYGVPNNRSDCYSTILFLSKKSHSVVIDMYVYRTEKL